MYLITIKFISKQFIELVCVFFHLLPPSHPRLSYNSAPTKQDFAPAPAQPSLHQQSTFHGARLFA